MKPNEDSDSSSEVIGTFNEDRLGLGRLYLYFWSGLGAGFVSLLLGAWLLNSLLPSTIPHWVSGPLLVIPVIIGLSTFYYFVKFASWLDNRRFHRKRHHERERFEDRPILSDEEFARLFSGDLASIAVRVRVELNRFIGQPDVTNRLRPVDEVFYISRLFDVEKRDLDWLEFVFVLEEGFVVKMPRSHWGADDLTLVEIVEACAGGTGERPSNADGAEHR